MTPRRWTACLWEDESICGALIGFSVKITYFVPWKNPAQPRKFLSFGPSDMNIGSVTSVIRYCSGFMDLSVTEANLNSASVQWGCNFTTHCRVSCNYVWGKHICSVEMHPDRDWRKRGRAGGRHAARAYNFKCADLVNFGPLWRNNYLNWKWVCIFSSVAGSKDEWHRTKFTNGSNYVLYSYLHKRHRLFHCTRICGYDAISLCTSLEQLIDTMVSDFL